MDNLIYSAYFSDDISQKSSHYHDCHQVIFITEGNVKVCVNGTEYTASKGSIMLFSRYENHSIEVFSTSYKRYILRIGILPRPVSNKIYSLLCNRPDGFDNVIDVSANMENFESAFKDIVNEAQTSDYFGAEMTEILIERLLIMLYRLMPRYYSCMEEQMFDLIYDLQRRLETDFADRYELSSLAKDYNVSVSTLSHQFKKITGHSIMEYLMSCRLASAKNYLIKTNMAVGEIVERCGFSDSSNFNRSFKKQSGLSPLQFRRKYKR